MSKPKLFIIMGKTMSGKSFLQRWLKDLGIEPIKTRTTRPKRYNWEDDYIYCKDVPYKRIAGREYNVAGGRRWYYWITEADLQITTNSSIIIDFPGYQDIVEATDIEKVEIVPIYLDVSFWQRMRNYVTSPRADDDEKELIRRIGADEKDFMGVENYKYCHRVKGVNEAWQLCEHIINNS